MILFALAAVACLAVAPQSDHVLVRDLVPEFAALRAAPQDFSLAFAPAPGAVRTFSRGELKRFAAELEIDADPASEICVERPVSVLNPEALLQAMRNSITDYWVEIVDFSRIPAPSGEIEFRLVDLRPTSNPEIGLWKGSVRYAGNRRFPIWASVKALAGTWKVFAETDLPAGKPIARASIHARQVRVLISKITNSISEEDVAGRVPRVTIHAGSEILPGLLEQPKDVMRGEPVKVRITSGSAQLEFDGIAESSGSAGARIQVRNPESNRTFPARVEGKGKAAIDVSTPKGIQ